MLFEPAYELQLEHGLCVGVRIPSGMQAIDPSAVGELTPAEMVHAESLKLLRQVSWVAGRVALRRALARLDCRPRAVLGDDRGAPILPPEVVGSISHKRELAVAMAAPNSGWTLGVDIEEREPQRYDISRRVLTPDELAEVADLDATTRPLAVLLRFSLKEAVYKAIDPFVRRFVGFQEVSVAPGRDGTTRVRLDFAPTPALDVEAYWKVHGGYYLTWARARPGVDAGGHTPSKAL